MWRGPVSRKFVYFCLSTDTKPTVGIEPFSICFETDTEKKYTFDGSTWQEDIEEPVTAKLTDSSNVAIDIQNPLPCDGDSVYGKDLELTYSTKVGWTGNIEDLFDCPHDQVGIYNDTVTNPKILYIPFCRTLYLSSIGLGCSLTGKSFSNVKIEFIGSDGTVRYTYDDSSNNTTYGTNLYSFPPTACVGIKLYFATAATTIGLSNITIRKECVVVSTIRGIDEDTGAVAYIKTSGGDFNVLARLRNAVGNAKIDPATSTIQTDGSQVTKISDVYGFEVESTPMGELRTIIPVRLIGTTFIGSTLDSNFATATVANDGTVTQGNCQLRLRTNTTANGSAVVQSKRTARYNGGSANRCRAIIQFSDTGKTNNTKKWGCFSATDGAYFKLVGTAISVNTLKGSSETSVALADWNGTTFTLDTNAHSYEIYYTNNKVHFVIDDILRHTVTASAATWSDTTNLPLRLENTNSGGSTTDTSVYCRVATIYRLGNLITQPTSYYQAGMTAGVVLKYGAGNLHSVILSGINNTSTVTIYDNTAASGTIIWSSGSMGAQTAPFPIPFQGLPFFTGLTLVISGANSNATVIYE